MDQRLMNASETGDIDALYLLIGEDPTILDRFDAIRFADTPLHIAARAGNTQFALEIVNLNPSLARKLNQSGFSPLHLAMAGGHELLASGLAEMDSELVLFKGRGGRAPVHEAAINGNETLLREFLSTYPRAFEALTFKRETALHLAVKHNQLEALKFMLEWLEENNKEHVLQWKDDQGDTILHMAAASPNYLEVIKLLLSRMVEVNAKNSQNLTALDVFDRESRRDPQSSMTQNLLCRAGALRAQDMTSDTPTLKITWWPQDITSDTPILKRIWRSLPIVSLTETQRYFQYRKGRDSPNDVRNVLLVCAILIATTTYQAALSPPGGTWQDTSIPLCNSTTTTTTPSGEEHPHYAGQSTMGRSQFLRFSFYNSLGFFFSIFMILHLTLNFPLYGALFTSLLAMIFTYVTAIEIVSPIRSREFEHAFFAIFLPLLVSLGLPPYFFVVTYMGCLLKTGPFKIFQRRRSGGNTSNSVASA